MELCNLDIEKAYGSVSWNFLDLGLVKMNCVGKLKDGINGSAFCKVFIDF